MNKSRAKSATLTIVLVAAIASVGLMGRHVVSQRARVMHALPSTPTIEPAMVELRAALQRAENRARGYLRSAQGLAELSQLYHANGFYQEAEACYVRLQSLEPHEARWPHLLANVLAGFGQLEDAQPLEARAVSLQPDYLPAALRLGEIEWKLNRAAAAVSTYNAVLKRDPGNRYALLGLAKCDLGAGNWTEGGEHVRAALASAPDFVGALSLLTIVAEHAGDAAAADAARAKIGKREFVDFPDPWVDELSADCFDPYRLSVAAAAAQAAGDGTAAQRWLERAIALDPTSGSYRRQLGKLFFQARNFSPARVQLERAVAISPGDSDAWALLVEILTAMGETSAADRALFNGLKACPQSAALHYTAGHRLSEAGRFAEAIPELKAAQALRSNEVNAGIDLAMIYFRAERIEEGVAELKAVLAAQPGHPLAMEILARNAIGSNDEADARRWLRELRLQPRVAPEDLKAIAEEFRKQFGHVPPPY